MKHINAFRWWLFKRLNVLIWGICPEPHRSNLEKIVTVKWKDLTADGNVIEAAKAELERRTTENHRIMQALHERAIRERNASH